jgi:hypothetical protein
VSAGWQASPITRIPDDPSARPKRVRI